jgi:hypothetical protein
MVKFQALDIIDVIVQMVLRLRVVYPRELNDHQLKAGGFKSFRRTSSPTESENG